MSDAPQTGDVPELSGELLNDFCAECDEHLNNIREALVELESSLGQGRPNAHALEQLSRNFHSFKGISAIVGLRPAETLAHEAEDFLRELNSGRTSLTPGSVDLLMDVTKKLEEIAFAFRSNKPLPDATVVSSTLQPKTRSNAAVGESAGQWRFAFTPSQEFDERGVNVNSVRERLQSIGEILRATPKVLGPGRVSFEFMVAVREEPANWAEWEKDGIAVAKIEKAAEAPALAISSTAHNPFIAPSHIVRVDLPKLDELMRITGEMVINRSRLDDHLARANRNTAALDLQTLNEVNLAFFKSLRELRRAIMKVRLVPASEIFARMPFVVRDLARETNKQARLELEGQQTELDKYLIERLKDPLLHLVRNAFSHGMETLEARVAAGKPAEATITLRAATQGDTVLIQVADDGGGIDAAEVRRRAVARGMNVPNELDSASLLNILCVSGFSTRDDADRAAGRGVGMAVVADTVRELGGTLSLETQLGRGTQFTLRLPLTLTIAETFIVSAANQTCAVPQSFVREVMQVQAEDIRTVNQVEIIPYRSGVLPITRLSSMFQLPPSEKPQLSVLVLLSERGESGLVVDKIHGQKEVVVRAVRDPLVNSPAVVGATELGDGKPVLILNGAALTSGPVKPHQAGLEN